LVDPTPNEIYFFNSCAIECSSSTGPGLNGADNVAIVYNYLNSKGLSTEQASGVAGNMIHESGLGLERLQNDPKNVRTDADRAEQISIQKQSKKELIGWGLVQWTPATKMITPSKASGKTAVEIATFGFELDFLWNQLNTNEKPALDGLKTATTPEDAALKFSHLYERSADLPGSDAETSRIIFARAVFELATKGTPLPPNIQELIANYGALGVIGSGSGAGCPSATTGYKNPFRDLKNSHSMRIDGGLDYGGEGVGEGPVYAVGPAKIVGVKTRGSGWPGLGTANDGAYILYQLTDGAAKDRFIYISEDCTPKVNVGDVIPGADTVICDYKDQLNPSFSPIAGTHLEIGWGDGSFNYVSWSDYKGAPNDFASNSGIDISKFLQKLGVAPGTVQGGPSTKMPPYDPPVSWPRW
jgi:hypothetical protein